MCFWCVVILAFFVAAAEEISSNSLGPTTEGLELKSTNREKGKRVTSWVLLAYEHDYNALNKAQSIWIVHFVKFVSNYLHGLFIAFS